MNLFSCAREWLRTPRNSYRTRIGARAEEAFKAEFISIRNQCAALQGSGRCCESVAYFAGDRGMISMAA
jgi:hypothetical protein